MMGYWGYGYEPGFWGFFGGILMLIFWIAVIVLIVRLIRGPRRMDRFWGGEKNAPIFCANGMPKAK